MTDFFDDQICGLIYFFVGFIPWKATGVKKKSCLQDLQMFSTKIDLETIISLLFIFDLLFAQIGVCLFMLLGQGCFVVAPQPNMGTPNTP